LQRASKTRGARQGWCLYKLLQGPDHYNACATVKWNNGTSFPIEAGHGCIGLLRARFWDKGGFYQPLSTGRWAMRARWERPSASGSARIASAALARKRQRDAEGG